MQFDSVALHLPAGSRTGRRLILLFDKQNNLLSGKLSITPRQAAKAMRKSSGTLAREETDGRVRASVPHLDESTLPAGNVSVPAGHSIINYKDGLVIKEGLRANDESRRPCDSSVAGERGVGFTDCAARARRLKDGKSHRLR